MILVTSAVFLMSLYSGFTNYLTFLPATFSRSEHLIVFNIKYFTEYLADVIIEIVKK